MDGAGAFGGSAAQPVGILPAFLVLRGLSYKDRPGPVWTSPAGVRVTGGDGSHDAPYSIDRGVFVGLASEAHRQGRSILATCRGLADMLGVSWPRCTALERLRRVTASTIEAPRHGPGCGCGCARMAPRATVAESFTHHRGTDTFSVTLTEAFMVEVQYGAPISLAAVSQLLSKSAALELYCALVLRAFRGERWPMPLFERGGLGDLIDLADTDYKARQLLGERLRMIRSFWPELPYELSGSVLVCTADPRAALAAHIDRAAGRDPRARHARPAPRQATARPRRAVTVASAPAPARPSAPVAPASRPAPAQPSAPAPAQPSAPASRPAPAPAPTSAPAPTVMDALHALLKADPALGALLTAFAAPQPNPAARTSAAPAPSSPNPPAPATGQVPESQPPKVTRIPGGGLCVDGLMVELPWIRKSRNSVGIIDPPRPPVVRKRKAESDDSDA